VAMVVPQPRMVWRPNRAVCIAVALFTASVVMVFLIAMFSRHPESSGRGTTISIRLISHPASKPAALKQTQVSSKSRLEAQTFPKRLIKTGMVPLKIIKPVPKPVDWQRQIQLGIESEIQNPPNTHAFMLNKNPAITPLQQALNAPRKPKAMRNGQNYRSEYGGIELKANGLCSELQTLQIVPSPSNRTTGASPTACPGGHQSGMGEELLKWASHEARAHSPPD
jgi:hypothetical protein